MLFSKARLASTQVVGLHAMYEGGVCVNMLCLNCVRTRLGERAAEDSIIVM